MMRLALAAAAAIASLSAAQASDLSCPASLDEGDDGVAGTSGPRSFRYVSFFDGDPSQMADLAPEDNSSTSQIDQHWRLVRSESRPIVMVCRYHDTQNTIQKEVPDDVRECRLQGFIDSSGEIVGSPTLSCD
jgi:hypothetical protein